MSKETSSAAGRIHGCRIFSFPPSDCYGISACALHPNFTAGFLRRRGNPFKFAHLPRDVSSTLGSHDAKLSMMNPGGNLALEAIATIVCSDLCLALTARS